MSTTSLRYLAVINHAIPRGRESAKYAQKNKNEPRGQKLLNGSFERWQNDHRNHCTEILWDTKWSIMAPCFSGWCTNLTHIMAISAKSDVLSSLYISVRDYNEFVFSILPCSQFLHSFFTIRLIANTRTQSMFGVFNVGQNKILTRECQCTSPISMWY